MQLHVHGSFSEGVGSIDSHSFEATDVGADVVWWSDHDFRIASYRHASRFGFEGWTEPLAANEPWSAGSRSAATKGVSQEPRPHAAADGAAEISDAVADEGRHSLRLEARHAGTTFAAREHELVAHRGLWKRPLASRITLDLSVLPEELGDDARAVVDVQLSEHAPHGELPLATYRLRYVLSNAGGGLQREGTTARIALPYRPGTWNRLSLPISRDAAKAFPWLVGGDDSLVAIAVGVESRRGARAAAAFDRLVLGQELAGDAAFARQAELLRKIGARYPRVTELQGVEISFVTPHLNEFSVDTELLDYDALRRGAADPDTGGARASGGSERRPLREVVVERAVAAAHARGGLISFNHMFGAAGEDAGAKATREEILAELAGHLLHGADVLEVGYRNRGGRDLADHLWVWDRLAGHGLHPVGAGVSDSHGGEEGRWRSGTNNFLSWIYATGPTKAELIEGLRAGRVYFGDITRFDGRLDLETGGGFRMGQIVITDRPLADVRIRVEGAAPGDTVRLVRSGEEIESIPVGEGSVDAPRTVDLAEPGATAVRIELRGADGAAKALGNPITFVRAVPDGGIAAARAAIDVAGVRSRRIAGFEVGGVEVRRGASAGDGPLAQRPVDAVVLHGRARAGTVELDTGELHAALALDAGETIAVELDGLRGRVDASPSRVVVDGIEGEGTIALRRP